MRRSNVIFLILTMAFAGGVVRGETGRTVDLLLVLLVDVSGSMAGPELDLQREGYVAALGHPDLAEAIAMGRHGGIGLAYVEWAGPEHQEVVIPCTIVASRNDAFRVSQKLAEGRRTHGQGTSISSALIFAAKLFKTCPATAPRIVIDISGNGPNNLGPDILAARDAVLATGATINGLPLTASEAGLRSQTSDPDHLSRYYESCVTGGPGAFMLPIADPSMFRAAILRKLLLEIAAGPSQLTLARMDHHSSFDCHLIGQAPGR